MWQHRSGMAPGWQAPAGWQGDERVVTAGDLHGLRLVLRHNGYGVLPNLHSTLFLSMQVRCLPFLLRGAP
jgi:hypothetical protein